MTRRNDTTAEQRLRDLRKEFRGFDKEAPGPDRAARLAAFARAAHADRQLNMAMHAAQLCLDEDPDAPQLLVGAYVDRTGPDDDPETRLHVLVDLRDLGRYLGRPDISEAAEAAVTTTAHQWVGQAGPAEQRYRLRTLASLVSRQFADDLRDKLAAAG